MYTISNTTKRNIERIVGVPLEKIAEMTVSEEKAWIEHRSKSPLQFSKRKRYGIIGRGNPLLARRKIRTFEDLGKRKHKLFKI